MFPVEVYFPLLTDFGGILRKNGIRFHLTGGIVSVVYSEPRFTQDVDIVVDPDAIRANKESFIRDLDSYLFEPSVIREAIENGRPFQLLDLKLTLKLDVYPRELVPGELSRSINHELVPGLQVPIVSLCDLAVAKLIWIGKGSHKSRSDLRRLLSRATDEERTTIYQMAADQRLTRLLDEVLSESDEIAE